MPEVAVGSEELSSGAPQPAPVPLTHHTARGFAWMIGQTLITKVTGIIGQIVLAWLISPADYGVVFIAYAVASLPTAVRDAGLQSILVQRQRFLKRWVNPVFGMSLAAGALSALILFAITPFAAARYHEPRLIGLLLILAFGSVVNAVGIVPLALVQIQLRFRLQAVLSLVCAMVMTGMSILMAWRGWGPYSFVVPTVFSNMLRYGVLWWVARYPVRIRLDISRWRFLFHDSFVLLLNQLMNLVIGNADYLILGARYRDSKEVVGQFSFAFGLSLQAIALITMNLAGVLFPALVRLSMEPVRQSQAFVRSMRLMAMIAVPACLLQGALAEPGIHLVFDPKWYPAIPILQVLSAAMAIHTVGNLYQNLSSAQGRFRLQLTTTIWGAVLFVLFVVVGTALGQGLAVAISELVFFAVTDPIWLYCVIKRDLPNPMAEVFRIYFAPVVASLIACGTGMLLTARMPNSKIDDVLRICAISFITLVIYVPLIRMMAPTPWKELLTLRHRNRS